MRKIIAFISILFAVILLVGCDVSSSTQPDPTSTVVPTETTPTVPGPTVVPSGDKVHVEFNEQELRSILSDVELQLNVEQGIRFTGDIDLNFFHYSRYEHSEEEYNSYYEVAGALEGAFDFYFNLKSYENMYMYISADLDVALEIKIGDEANLPFVIAGTMRHRIYIIEGDVFVDSSLTAPGFSYSVQQKMLNLIDEDDFNEFLLMVDATNDEMADEEVDLADLLTELLDVIEFEDFKFFIVGDSHEIEIDLAQVFEEMLTDLEEEDEYSYGDYYEEYSMTILEMAVQEVLFNVKLSNKIEHIGLKTEFLVDLESVDTMGDNEYEETTTSRFTIDLKLELMLNLEAPVPSNLPQKSDFSEYADATHLLGLLGPALGINIDVDLPEISQEISASSFEVTPNRVLQSFADEDDLKGYLEDIGYALDLDEALRIGADFDFYFESLETYEWDLDPFVDTDHTKVKMKGNVDLYVNANDPSFKAYMELNLDLQMLSINNFDQMYAEVFIEAKFYLIDDNLYVDIILSNFGGELIIKQNILDVNAQDGFDLIDQMLTDTEVDFVYLGDLVDMLLELELPLDVFTLYKIGSVYELEADLEDVLKGILDFEDRLEEDDGEVIYSRTSDIVKDTVEYGRAGIAFDENVIKAYVDAKIDFEVIEEILEPLYFNRTEITHTIVKGRLTLLVDLNPAVPAKPTQSQLNAYPKLDMSFFDSLLDPFEK